MHQYTGRIFLLLACVVAVGCNKAPGAAGPAKPPEVEFTLPVRQMIVDTEEFPGRTVAVNNVKIVPHVQGYLQQVLFVDGADVKKDQVLAIIDQRQYKATQIRAVANLEQAKALRNRLDADYGRAQVLYAQRTMSKEDYDKTVGDYQAAVAAVGVADAELRSADLNVTYSVVRAPFDGRISNRLVDPGSMMLADMTTLTTIVSEDIIRAEFDMDERTMLQLQRLAQKGEMPVPWAQTTYLFNDGPFWLKNRLLSSETLPLLRPIKQFLFPGMTIKMGLADEEGKGAFPHEGWINFADNTVNRQTGTRRMRAEFDNRDHRIIPGLYARIQVPIGPPRSAVLISDRALGTDQGQKFVYVINNDNEVVYREVRTGSLSNGLRVIEEGLSEGERVIVTGQQRAKRGAKVTPKMVDMPHDKEAHSPQLTTGSHGSGTR